MRLRLLVSVLLLTTFSFAQVTPPDAPSKDQVLKLIDLLRVRGQMKEMMEQLREQVRAGALQNLRARVPKPTPEQIAAVNGSVDELTDDMQRKYSLDQMIDDIVPVYQRHLTRADLDSVVAFYSSPAGQKVLDEMPAMMQETIQTASARMQPIVEAAMDKMDQRIQDITGIAASPDDSERPPLKRKPATTTRKPSATKKN